MKWEWSQRRFKEGDGLELTVVRVTPARAAAAPTTAKTPGTTQSPCFVQVSKMVAEGYWLSRYSARETAERVRPRVEERRLG